MEFNNVVRTRRAVRAYLPDEVPANVFRRIFENVRVAPSANNAQPWHFVVIKRPDLKLKIARLAFSHKFIAQAPLIIICCGKSYANPYGWIGNKMFLLDCAAAMDHLTLTARNEGLGTCWVGSFYEEQVKAVLGIPAPVRVVELLTMGYPADTLRAKSRLPLEQIVCHERWAF